jgi:hypothetical protein
MDNAGTESMRHPPIELFDGRLDDDEGTIRQAS